MKCRVRTQTRQALTFFVSVSLCVLLLASPLAWAQVLSPKTDHTSPQSQATAQPNEQAEVQPLASAEGKVQGFDEGDQNNSAYTDQAGQASGVEVPGSGSKLGACYDF